MGQHLQMLQPNVRPNAIRHVDRTTIPAERWWTVQHGPGPVVATAIHDGHEL